VSNTIAVPDAAGIINPRSRRSVATAMNTMPDITLQPSLSKREHRRGAGETGSVSTAPHMSACPRARAGAIAAARRHGASPLRF